jgi:hypothetical protein
VEICVHLRTTGFLPVTICVHLRTQPICDHLRASADPANL